MADDECVAADADELTADEARVLKEFASNMLTAKHLLKWIALLAGGVAAIAAGIYYILSALQQMRDVMRAGGLH